VLDTDRLIEDEAQLTVPQIFERHGEARFRTLETALLERLAAGLLDNQPHVIATGGGMPVTPGNFERLQALGEVIFLKADLEVLTARLMQEGGRPLLARSSHEQAGSARHLLKEKLAGLVSQRTPVYSRARYKLDTDELTPEGIADQVLKLLGLPA
jgi:shikimate kinase